MNYKRQFIKEVLVIAFLFFVVTVTFAEEPPAAQLSVPSSVPPVKAQEAQAALIELGCKQKADLAVIIFAAREEGNSEKVILERVKEVVKNKIAEGAILNYADEIDFYRMIRDIFRKTSSGDYKIPVEYIEDFAWVEYRSCIIIRSTECSFIASEGFGKSERTECIDNS